MVESVAVPTILVARINYVAQVAEAFGIRRHDLLAKTSIKPEWLLRTEDRVPVKYLHEVYQAAIDLTGIDDLGLFVGRVAYTNGQYLQHYMTTVCDTFLEYLNTIPSTLRLYGDVGRIRFRQSDDFIRLEWHPIDPATSQERYLSDELLVVSSAIVQSICIQTIPIRAVQFTYSKPEDVGRLQEIFGTKLNFGSDVSCLVFDRACLHYPLIKLGRGLDVHVADKIKSMFESQAPTEKFLNSVRQAIIRTLPIGGIKIDVIADELGISRRTLQRRLTERDFIFKQLLQDVRAELAIRHLSDSRLSITEIGYLLGYSDQAAFSYAFRNWYQQTPSSYRAEL